MSHHSTAVVHDTLVRLGVPAHEITHDASLAEDLAIDSTEKIELLSLLEEVLNVRLDNKALKDVHTVAELTAFVEDYSSQKAQ